MQPRAAECGGQLTVRIDGCLLGQRDPDGAGLLDPDSQLVHQVSPDHRADGVVHLHRAAGRVQAGACRRRDDL